MLQISDLSESTLRTAVFFAVFATMAAAEALLPKRKRSEVRGRRWLTNGALVALDTIAVRVVLPVLAVSAAAIATDRGWGMLSLVTWPWWLELIIAIVLLDLLIYAQHVASHKLPVLWAVHKVHHADRDIDVTTGFRFHPIEIVLSMAFKILCIFAIGPAAIAVFVFEVLLSSSAMFNHANLRLSPNVDRVLRLFFVTPDMHRVHHSVVYRETDSNYGFCLSVWDRLFATYIPQPIAGHDGMTIGLEEYQDERPSSIRWSLLAPFLPRRPHPAAPRTSQTASKDDKKGRIL